MGKQDDSASSLFEYVLVVQIDDAFSQKVEVTYRYPPEQKESISGAIMRFCFPEADFSSGSDQKSGPKGEKKSKSNRAISPQNETFSFTLTEVDGRRRFGYCRRLHVIDSKNKTRKVLECYCILSLNPSFSLFRQMLDIIEERRKVSSSAVYTFLKSVQANKFPRSGETLEVSTFAVGKEAEKLDGPVKYKLSRPAETGYEYLDYVSFANLHKLVGTKILVELFGLVALERRLIVIAKTLGTISSCISAIVNMAYPLTWQHVYIPVLPKSLLDYCCAPMPFMVGVLANHLDQLLKMPLEDVVVLDLDKGSFVRRPNFDVSLPEDLRADLVARIDVAAKSKSSVFDLAIAEALMHFQRSLLSTYILYLDPVERFKRDAFVNSFPENHRSFMREYQNSQMWSCFVDERQRQRESGRVHELGTCPLLTKSTPGEQKGVSSATGTPSTSSTSSLAVPSSVGKGGSGSVGRHSAITTVFQKEQQKTDPAQELASASSGATASSDPSRGASSRSNSRIRTLFTAKKDTGEDGQAANESSTNSASNSQDAPVPNPTVQLLSANESNNGLNNLRKRSQSTARSIPEGTAPAVSNPVILKAGSGGAIPAQVPSPSSTPPPGNSGVPAAIALHSASASAPPATAATMLHTGSTSAPPATAATALHTASASAPPAMAGGVQQSLARPTDASRQRSMTAVRPTNPVPPIPSGVGNPTAVSDLGAGASAKPGAATRSSEESDINSKARSPRGYTVSSLKSSSTSRLAHSSVALPRVTKEL